METVEFILPWKIDSKLSLNRIYMGGNWQGRSKMANNLHYKVGLELKVQRIPMKIFSSPVSISFWWNTMLDLDNHGYVTKLIIDGLKGYLIKDDTKKYITEIHHAYWLGDGVKVSISEI